MTDDLPRIETHHSRNGLDLHFRFMGEHDGRAFIINVQFSGEDERTGKIIRPEEYDFAVAKLLRYVTEDVVGREPASA